MKTEKQKMLEITNLATDYIKQSKYFGGYFKDHETGAECKYSKNIKNDLIIYVLPTNEPIDMLTNISFFPKLSDTSHAGYKKSAENIFKHLVKNKISFRNVFIIGYSMGGGIAPLLGEKIYYNLGAYPEIQVVSLSGTSYDTKNIESHRLRVLNVENGNDTITKFFPFLKKSGYTLHVGKPRRWCKTGLVFKKNNNKTGITKWFDIPEHYYINLIEAIKIENEKEFEKVLL